MSSFEKIDKYMEKHLDANIEELSHLVSIPSIAAQNTGQAECAELVAKMLSQRGFDVEILPTQGAPVVFGEIKGKVEKTLIFYNHYDVQPPEPLELWESAPFEATRRDGKVFGRGISDDKAHITSRLLAIDALLDVEGELPCNIKFVIEGEEEIGSVHLPEFVKQNAERLAADVCIWEFGGVDHRDVPVQYLGLRGICYVELSLETASIDAHSGLGGSIFPNAAWRLVWALNTLKNQEEHILIDGYYDNVVPPSERDWELFGKLPDPAEEYKTRYTLKEFLKDVEGGAALRVQETLEPTCTICGLTSGYQEAGSKTVLPAKASAKIDFRLVPNQTPEETLSKLRAHLDKHGFEDIQMEYLGGEAPGRTDPDHPFVQLVVQAAEEVYQAPMELHPMNGGSGPNHAFIEYLNVPVATAGVGYPGTQAHAPNENIRLDLYMQGARHIARILKAFGDQP